MMNVRDWKNRFGFLLSALFVSSLALVTLPGCDDDTYEETGEQIDEGIDETGDAFEDFGEETEDTVDDMGDEFEDLDEDLDYEPEEPLGGETP